MIFRHMYTVIKTGVHINTAKARVKASDIIIIVIIRPLFIVTISATKLSNKAFKYRDCRASLAGVYVNSAKRSKVGKAESRLRQKALVGTMVISRVNLG